MNRRNPPALAPFLWSIRGALAAPFLLAAMPAYADAMDRAMAAASALGGRVAVVQGTKSMLPVIGRHDLLVYTPASIDAVRVGDIVVFRWTDPNCVGSCTVLVAHRVLWKTHRDSLLTKGDNNDAPDGFRPTRADVVGIVRNIVKAD